MTKAKHLMNGDINKRALDLAEAWDTGGRFRITIWFVISP
jgi:hypothetical protein